jgi:predicted transcriptional regulator
MFIKKHKRYFENHRLDSVSPNKFLQRSGALSNCKTVNSATAVFQSLKKMQWSATKSLKIIVSQAWAEEGEIFIGRAEHGVKIFSIIGQNTIFPRNVIKNIIPKINTLASRGNLKRRMIEKGKVAAFIVDDHEAAVTFPNAEDEAEMTTVFVGQDPDFSEWCLDYFNYVWKDSNPLI